MFFYIILVLVGRMKMKLFKRGSSLRPWGRESQEPMLGLNGGLIINEFEVFLYKGKESGITLEDTGQNVTRESTVS